MLSVRPRIRNLRTGFSRSASSAEFDQIIHVCSYSSISSGAVSSFLPVPSDVSGKLSVRKVVLFGGEAV